MQPSNSQPHYKITNAPSMESDLTRSQTLQAWNLILQDHKRSEHGIFLTLRLCMYAMWKKWKMSVAGVVADRDIGFYILEFNIDFECQRADILQTGQSPYSTH